MTSVSRYILVVLIIFIAFFLRPQINGKKYVAELHWFCHSYASILVMYG